MHPEPQVQVTVPHHSLQNEGRRLSLAHGDGSLPRAEARDSVETALGESGVAADAEVVGAAAGRGGVKREPIALAIVTGTLRPACRECRGRSGRRRGWLGSCGGNGGGSGPGCWGGQGGRGGAGSGMRAWGQATVPGLVRGPAPEWAWGPRRWGG